MPLIYPMFSFFRTFILALNGTPEPVLTDEEQFQSYDVVAEASALVDAVWLAYDYAKDGIKPHVS